MMRQRRPPLSPEKQIEAEENFKKIMNKAKEEEEREFREEFLPTRERVATCRCGGGIVVETTYHFEPDSPRSMFVGLRNLGRFARTECFCESCGALYKPEVVKK